jgi:hypothetical protein
MTARGTTTLPAAISREPSTNLNLNINTGPLVTNINGRIPFIAVKGFLSQLTNGDIKYLQKDGYIDIADILTNPPICNKLLYIVPDTNADLVKSCILSCLELSCSQMVKQHMNLFNIYQQAIVKPATSKIPNVVRKSYTNVLIMHGFDYTNVQTTMSVSGVANKRLKEISKKCVELSTVTGIDNLDDTELKKQSKRHLDDINQYLTAELALCQLSLNKGILNKCVQIAKGNCIARPLARVINRYYESLWDKDKACDDIKRECYSKILGLMADQTNAAIYELEHHPITFLPDLIHEFLDSRIITDPLTKGNQFTIDNKMVGGIIVMPLTSSSILNMYTKSKLKEGVMECVKNVYFKPDDIFATPTDKDQVEMLYKDGININRANADDIKTEDLLAGKDREKSKAVVKLTQAGKQVLTTAIPVQNNLMGEKREFVIAKIHFKKLVQYYEHLGKVYPIEILKYNVPEDSESQWIMNSEINHMGVVVWGGINKKSKLTESYATSLENGILAHDKILHNPHNLFTVKSVSVQTPGLDSSMHRFDAYEALKALVNPTRFSCRQVLESINTTADRVYQLAGEHTQYVQSYYNAVNTVCDNHRKLYRNFMKSLTIDGRCINENVYDQLIRVEYKQFYTLTKTKEGYTGGKYAMIYRYLAGSIPWYCCGDEVNAIRGNKLLISIQNTEQWTQIAGAISKAKDYLDHTPSCALRETVFNRNFDGFDRLKDAGFNTDLIMDGVDTAEYNTWCDEEMGMEEKWRDADVICTDTIDFVTQLKSIANMFINAFMALFPTAHEYELNYLFAKNNKSLTRWLLIANVILPVLSKGKMKLSNDGHEQVIINMNNECPLLNMILCNDHVKNFKTYVLSCNVARMATLSKYSILCRMASIVMMFMYNTPYAIEQMVCKGIHTGFSIAYVKSESTLAEDVILLHPNSIELIMGNGETDTSDVASDGSTTIALTCEMQYTTNTIGPVGLLAQCVYPKPSLINNAIAKDGSIKISSDIISRTYSDKRHVIADLSFGFNSKNMKIIEQNMREIMDCDMVPYAQISNIRNEYVPIICPAIDVIEKSFPILGLERCADFSKNGGKSAFHAFFFTEHPSHTKNPYMSNLFSEGPVRYMKDTLMIDGNVPIKTFCFPKDRTTGATTQIIEDMYNMHNECSVSLTSEEQAAFTNFDDQMKLRSSVTQIPCLLPDNRYFSYVHPDLRLGNAIPYTQYTADDSFIKQTQQSKATPGGDTKIDGTPFGFIRRSPFTANRDRNIRMVDTSWNN